jgi:hypothetical protein
VAGQGFSEGLRPARSVRSHRITVVSSLAVARVCLSGVNAIDSTESL